MASDGRNRVTGTSDHKKRKFGRKKKRNNISGRGTGGKFSSTSSTNTRATLDSGRPTTTDNSARPSTSTQTSQAPSSGTPALATLASTPRIVSSSSDGQPSTAGISRSSKKLKSPSVEASTVRNRIIDISILFPQLSEHLVCKECHGAVKFSEVDIRGLGSEFVITCTSCHRVFFSKSSPKIGKQGNAYEVNRRSVLVARCLGHGLSGLKTLCAIYDLPQPISHSNYDKINKDLKIACEEVAKESMRTAMEEEFQDSENISVSGDGSYRKRGFTSLQGFSSLIRFDNGKVVDVAPKQSYCNGCMQHPEEDTEAYREWLEKHQPVCSANHTGSAGKMEVDGIVEMFQRSESTYGVKYKNYIGDGDSKVYKAVCEAMPYGEDFEIKKKECVQHVQKRMGTRLRNFKTSCKGKLSDGKTIGGRGRLTAQVIDQLTRYYGNAIRTHSDSLDNMHNAIWATFYHKMSTDDKPQHHLCPPGSNSWCKWQQAKAQSRKALKNFKHTSSIPTVIMEAIKPIYTDLTDKNLLERCLGGFTQNTNESFNQSVWKVVPKTFFSGLTVLEIGIYTAVICYNDGKAGFLHLMKRFGIQPGTSAVQWAASTDEERVFFAERKTAAESLEGRRARRKRNLAQEDDSYVAGGH